MDHAQTAVESIAGDSLSVRFCKLTPAFGAEVTGLDLRHVASESIQPFLNQALLDHQVLLFRDQLLEEEQQARLAQSFGACRKMSQTDHYKSDNEFVQYLSNVDKDGQSVGVHPDPNSTYWHVDGTHKRVPSKVTILNALQVPGDTGHTMFASLYQLFEDLDDDSKSRFAAYEAEHHMEFRRASRDNRLPHQWFQARRCGVPLSSQLKWWASTMWQRWRDGGVYHPIIRRHTETGRLTLFIGDHAWRIKGRLWPAGIKLMREMNSVEIGPSAAYTHRWRKGDLLMWDNTSVLHRAAEFDVLREARVLRRCVVLGE